MEDITHYGYMNAERVFKIFNNENLGNYHNLYVQDDTFVLKYMN